MSDFNKSIENELDVAGRVAAATPTKMLEEVRNDWNNDKSKLLTTTIESAAIGLAAGIAYKAAPVATMLATGLMTGIGVIGKTAPMIKDAWNADSEDQRSDVANKFSSDFGRTGATMVEGLPGLMVGGKIASASFARSEGLRDLAYNNITKPIEFPIQEKLAFNRKGAALLPEGSVNGGTIDALKLSDTVPARSDVELARSLDLARGKASRLFTGDANNVVPSFENKPGQVLIHTQPLEKGPSPSLPDLKATSEFGIIRSGDYRSFYIGQKGLNTGEAQLRALVIDDANKQAFLLHNQPGKGYTWEHAAPQYVDYEGAMSTLKTVDVKNAWSQFQSIPKVAAELHPQHSKISWGEKLDV